jgi:cellulose synthase (UDP-forming)
VDAILQAAAPMLLLLGVALLVLPTLDPANALARRIGAAVTAALMLRYMWWRCTETLPPLDEPGGVAGLVFLGVEMLASLAGLLLLHVLSRTSDRSAEADAHPVERFPGGPPMIDILVATYNEKREILLRTLVGALGQDYPRFRVWVLDDGRRDWLRDLAEELGAGYLTRGDNADAKAGNINAALRTLMALPDPAAAYAILDADFVPTPRFLRRSVALLHDPGVGCVQTPQNFFNPDPIQLNLRGPAVVADEQRFFFDVILPSKDAHGTAFSCGTSSLVRREALQDIGLVPTESVTEDMLLSIKLAGAGWRTVYLNERLSVGLAPEGMQEYLTQRGRWCLGAMQIGRSDWGPLGRARVPWLLRLHTMDTLLFWTVGSAVKILAVMAPLLYWWFGLVVMRTDLPGILDHLGPSWIAWGIFLGWVSRGTHLPIMAEAVGLLVAKEALRASAVGLFGSRDQKFKVTAKGANRHTVVVQWGMVLPFLALAIGTIGGILWRVAMGPVPGTQADVEAMNLFWSGYNCLVLFIACLICVEQPRHRAEERFDADEPVLLRPPGRVRPEPVRLRDLSISGCRLERPAGGAALAIGDAVQVAVGGVGEVAATVRRVTATTLHLSFEATATQQAAIIRKVFSGAYVRPVGTTPPIALLRVLARRALG